MGKQIYLTEEELIYIRELVGSHEDFDYSIGSHEYSIPNTPEIDEEMRKDRKLFNSITGKLR